MTTTIQVSERTLRLLKSLKNQLGKRSYDQVLREVLPQHLPAPASLAGAFPGLKQRRKAVSR